MYRSLKNDILSAEKNNRGGSAVPDLYVIGDSTVEDNTPPFRGWGWALREMVNENVRVFNHAVSGRSTKSFLHEGRFEAVKAAMQPGDVLLIQFGHNDEKDDEERHTDPDASFLANLNAFCDGAVSCGAAPVLITPVCRRFFVGHTSLLYTHGEYAAAVRRLAAMRCLPLCDLKAMSRRLYLELGEDKTAELFVRIPSGVHPDFPDGHEDMTHFNEEGARRIARLIAEWMQGDERFRALIRP